MVEIKNLTKKIGQNLILDNISFCARSGEILGFLGPNGAGKSTTMKIITCFWRPTSGKVEVGGFDVSENSLSARKKIGYLPETAPLYDDMQVGEYLKFVAEVRGMDKSKSSWGIKKAANLCGLDAVAHKPIEELSKGYRQRVGLAQAIIHDPDILILDEPTVGLDPSQIIEIRNLIKELGKKKTVIFSTHILAEAEAVCDRIVIINHGRIAGQGKPDELAAKAGSAGIIYVKIKGLKNEVEKKLKEMENVVAVKIKDQEAEDVYGYEIEPEAGVDLREYLSLTVMQNNWSILEFSKKSANLENIFIELTK